MRTLRSILFIIGIFLLLFSVTMIVPIFVDGERIIFISGFIITCLSGTGCILLGKVNKLHGVSVVFMTTSCIWIVLSLFAAVPFYFNHYSYIDSLFEAVSGITTTGATIVKSIELEPRNILLWRAMLHSIGGISIITTGIAVFPIFKNFSINSFLYSEYSDATKRNLPNIRSVVLDITMIYYGLILLCIFFYYLAGMSLFDSICHGMSTVSTGGFENYSNSIGHYNNSIFESITITFMILGSLPFLSYLRNIKHFNVYHDEQVYYFLATIILASLLAFLWLYGESDLKALDSVRYGTFTVVSLITSTGYTLSKDIDSGFVAVLTFLLTFIGGCNGSASGGIKIFRIIVLFKSMKSYLKNTLGIKSSIEVKFNKKIITDNEILAVFIFFVIYILTFAISSILMAYLSKADFLTSISSVSATLTNSGPRIGNLIVSSDDYSFFSNEVRLFLSFLMILGRLEILPIYFFIYSLFIYSLFKFNSK